MSDVADFIRRVDPDDADDILSADPERLAELHALTLDNLDYLAPRSAPGRPRKLDLERLTYALVLHHQTVTMLAEAIDELQPTMRVLTQILLGGTPGDE